MTKIDYDQLPYVVGLQSSNEELYEYFYHFWLKWGQLRDTIQNAVGELERGNADDALSVLRGALGDGADDEPA